VTRRQIRFENIATVTCSFKRLRNILIHYAFILRHVCVKVVCQIFCYWNVSFRSPTAIQMVLNNTITYDNCLKVVALQKNNSDYSLMAIRNNTVEQLNIT